MGVWKRNYLSCTYCLFLRAIFLLEIDIQEYTLHRETPFTTKNNGCNVHVLLSRGTYYPKSTPQFDQLHVVGIYHFLKAQNFPEFLGYVI